MSVEEPITCANCGAANAPGRTTCGECGKPLVKSGDEMGYDQLERQNEEGLKDAQEEVRESRRGG